MNIKGFLIVIIGVLIILSVTIFFPISFWTFLECIFAFGFFAFGLKIFKRFKSEYLGSLIFSGFLIFDILNRIFNFMDRTWNFWQLIGLLIGSYLLSWGLSEIVRKSVKSSSIQKFTNQNLELKKQEKYDNFFLDIDLNLTRLLLVDNGSEEGFYSNLKFEKTQFKGTLDNKVENSNCTLISKCKNKNDSIKGINKSIMNLEMNSFSVISGDINIDASDAILDFSKLKLKELNITSNLSRISLTLSSVFSGEITITSDVTSININIPKKAGVKIETNTFENLKGTENFEMSEDKIISKDILNCTFVSTIKLNSDMSKITLTNMEEE